MSRFVAIHLLTTGPSEKSDGIIALAGVRVNDGKLGERLSLMARPRRPCPASPRLDAGDKERLDEGVGAAELVKFIGNDPIVAHAGDVALRFLESRWGSRLGNPPWDTREMGRILLPAAASFDLADLCRACGTPLENAGALAAAEALARLWLALLLRLEQLPLPVLSAISSMLEPTRHPLRPFFEEAEKRRLVDAMMTGEKRSVADLLRDFSPIIGRKTATAPRVPPEKLDLAEVAEIFSPAGKLARTLSAFKHRPEQMRMAQEVCEAYNTGSFLLCEAGTGTGKSLAYLAPTLLWALRNRERVVISTNTKNLQAQLYFKDLPLLQRALNAPLRTAIIKGRSNYLCARKFINLVEDAERELEAEERALMPPLLTWAAATESGDVAENAGFLGGFSSELWSKLCSRAEECGGGKCRFGRNCFVRRARALAQQADVIVANHAVVFAEMGAEGAILPEYAHVVFDEAHNIENVATDFLSKGDYSFELARLLNRLHRGGRDGAGRGLFTNIRFQARRATRLPPGADEAMEREIQASLLLMTEAQQSAHEFANAVGLLFLRAPRDCDKARYRGEAPPDNWGAIQSAGERLIVRLQALGARLEALRELIGDAKEAMGRGEELRRSLTAEMAILAELAAEVGFLLRAEDDNYVYWAESSGYRNTPYLLRAAPLDIGRLMRERFYSEKSTVVFSSATLTVRGSFDFMRERLGLDGVEVSRRREASLGSSFDFERQVLFGVPMFLPDPDDAAGGFSQKFTDLASAALSATQGRGLVLFTSYRMLNESRERLREELGRQGIRVLAQGIDGERSHITGIFMRDTHSVLLGAQSFWEGVDVAGESLSCLIVAKLPFHVFTDPIIAGRCERLRAQGRDPFHEYTLPSAVIRLKQGFGRLIRTHEDRGIVIVADRRIATRGYGREFLDSLPTRPRMYQSMDALIRDAAAFLDGSR